MWNRSASRIFQPRSSDSDLLQYLYYSASTSACSRGVYNFLNLNAAHWVPQKNNNNNNNNSNLLQYLCSTVCYCQCNAWAVPILNHTSKKFNRIFFQAEKNCVTVTLHFPILIAPAIPVTLYKTSDLLKQTDSTGTILLQSAMLLYCLLWNQKQNVKTKWYLVQTNNSETTLLIWCQPPASVVCVLCTNSILILVIQNMSLWN